MLQITLNQWLMHLYIHSTPLPLWHHPTMSSTSPMGLMFLLLVIITCLTSPAFTQPNSPLTPTIAECGPRILPLAMCAPFVQGVSTDPSQACCDNLRRVNDQQPRCLCLLLNNSAVSATFPINATLAMQLPRICSVNFDIVSCTGAPLPSMPPTPQVSLGSTTNSTSTASSPTTRILPKSGLMGYGFNHNYAMKFKGWSPLRMLGIMICIWANMFY